MKKQFRDLDLNNAFLFAAALQEPDICQMVLEIILGRKFPKVRVHTEHTVLFSSDLRSIRLDVYASTETEVKYNLEMQNDNERNLPKRSRFHQAEMDVTSLKPGEDFNELKPGYVIFICTFDPFGRGRYRYTFEERCLEEDFPLGDETRKIFLSTKGKNAEDTPALLVHFLKYMEESTDACVAMMQEPALEKLHDRIDALKRSRNLEANYMTVGDWVNQQAKIEAREMAPEIAREMAEEMAKEMAQNIAREMAEKSAQNMAEEKVKRIVAEDILDILEARYKVPSEFRDRIFAGPDISVLRSWHRLAVSVSSLEEFTSKM